MKLVRDKVWDDVTTYLLDKYVSQKARLNLSGSSSGIFLYDKIYANVLINITMKLNGL